MSVIDALLSLSDSQALTVTANSTNVVDTGSANARLGAGRPLWLVVVCEVAMGGTSPTLDIDVESDDNDSLSSPTDIGSYPQITSMAVGDRIAIALPSTHQRYIGVEYTMGGTSPTVTLSAYITDQEPEDWVALADAI